MNVLEIRHLTVGYTRPRRVVIEGLNLSLAAGELVCLIGPNGAGKSTLMRTIAGLQPPLEGEIRLMGDDIRKLSARDLAQRLSMVLTERVDVGLLPAYSLVALGRHPYTGWSGRLTTQDEQAVREAISQVGAGPLASRPVSELSDGERQKIMIARALAQEPELMLLDEPTAYLDLPRRVEMMGLLLRLAHETGRAILLSTHDLDLALRSADRIWLLPDDGTMHVGAPEDLVLSGAFETAFHSEGVQFDPHAGSFAVNAQHRGSVALEGEELARAWTQRALERVGFSVTANGAKPLARIVAHEGAWEVIREDKTVRCASLYEVVGEMAAW